MRRRETCPWVAESPIKMDFSRFQKSAAGSGGRAGRARTCSPAWAKHRFRAAGAFGRRRPADTFPIEAIPDDPATATALAAARWPRSPGRTFTIPDSYPCRTRAAIRLELALANLLIYLAPRAGFEPATNRLTAGCSTTELPGNTALMHATCGYNKRVLKCKAPSRRCEAESAGTSW